MEVIQINENFNDLEKVEELAINAFPKEEYITPKILIELSKMDLMNFNAIYG